MDALDSETEFMLFEPGERQLSLTRQSTLLSQATDSNQIAYYVIEDLALSLIAGFVRGQRTNNQRDQHNMRLVIGIRQAYTGQGWGLKLLEQLENWGKTRQVSRLELGVMTTNERAIKLYKKFGFEIEGTRKNAIRLKSGFQHEYVMGKLL